VKTILLDWEYVPKAIRRNCDTDLICQRPDLAEQIPALPEGHCRTEEILKAVNRVTMVPVEDLYINKVTFHGEDKDQLIIEGSAHQAYMRWNIVYWKNYRQSPENGVTGKGADNDKDRTDQDTEETTD